MKILSQMAATHHSQFQKRGIRILRQVEPGSVAVFQLSRKTMQRASCHHQVHIKDRGPYLTTIMALITFLCCQRRRTLAVDLVLGNLGWGLHPHAAGWLQLHRPRQQALVRLSHHIHQVSVTDTRFPDNPALRL